MPFHFVLVASVWPAMHQLDYITMSEAKVFRGPCSRVVVGVVLVVVVVVAL